MARLTLSTSGLVIGALLCASLPAEAERRTPAPIDYVGQGSRQAQTTSQTPRANPDATRDAWRGPVTRTGSVNLPTTRQTISFSYPGAQGQGTPTKADTSRQVASVDPMPKAAAPRKPADLWPAEATVQPDSSPRAMNRTLTLGSKNETAAASAPARTATLQPVATNVAAPEERGLASWYGEEFDGQPTANGEIFDMTAMTAAHRTLPLPSLAQVINEANGKEVVVRINDRGPFTEGRIIDLSKRAAMALDITSTGVAPVTVRYLGPAPALSGEEPVMASKQADPQARPQQIASIQDEPAEPAAPRTDLYGDYLLGGVEPSLGVPDPGKTEATPARLAAAEPKTVPAGNARVVTESLAPVEPQPAPQPKRISRPEVQYASSAPATSQSRSAGFTPQIYVQVGAFADISNAQGMNVQVGSSFPVDIESVRLNGSDYFRVLVGPYNSRDAAERAKVQLKVRGVQDSFIVVR